MWSRSLFRSFGGRPLSSGSENKKKRRTDKRHASSSSENVSQRNGHTQPQKSTSPVSWWNQQRAAFGNAVSGIGNALNKIKPSGLEVKVDVDMIKPTLLSIQTASQESWLKIPSPVRQAARRTISRQRDIQAELEDQIKRLEGANAALSAPRSIYKDGMGEYVTAMTSAVSQATKAAARAAEAAAVATEACAIRAKSGIRPIRRTAQDRSSER